MEESTKTGLRSMVKCRDVFECGEVECPAYDAPDRRCWLFTGTRCRNALQGRFLEKMDLCLSCEVFEANLEVVSLRETVALLNQQLKESRRTVRERERQLEDMGLELALGLSEVFEACKRISAGDPAVRIDESSEIELIAKLKCVINETAANVGEIIDQSHEFAMELAEHFDVFQRVSRGDLTARVSGESDIELLQSLKVAANRMIEDVSAEIRERKEAEESLLKKEEMLGQAAEEWRITFDSMPYGILLLDLDMNIIRVNKCISLLCGVPPEDIERRKCGELLPCCRGVKDKPLALRRGGLPFAGPSEYFDERFKKHFMQYLTPVPGRDGITKGFVVCLIDITEIKDKQRKLSESRDAFFNMLKELDFSYKELRGLFEGLIHSFVNAMDAKSPWTKGHSERVKTYAVATAREFGLEEKEIEKLRIAALLHDIGKIGTYDMVLDKPSRLTKEEFVRIKLHPVQGEEILKPISQLRDLLPIIRHHHERFDGGGYPDGLAGEDIPLGARIVHVADSFDSMTSDRPYRPAPGREYAFTELKRCSGTQFDSRVVQAFLKACGGENLRE